MPDTRRTGSATSIPERFALAVRRWPHEVAVMDGRARVTYSSLAASVRHVVGALQTRGVRRGDRIGLRMARSADCIAALLGIMSAGAAYVPLEPSMPDARLRHMAAENDLRIVLVGPGLSWTGTESTVDLAVISAEAPTEPVRVPVSPEDLCYVPYTSGSTGAPKGVEVPHRSVTGFFAGTDYASWGPGSVMLHHSALSWDAHLLEIYPALLGGGTVVVFPGDTADPQSVVRYATARGVTVMFLATQAFNTVVGIDVLALSGLRSLIIGGENAAADHVGRALATVPELRLVNIYGPVECTVLASAHVITGADAASGSIPIGAPVGDREITVHDGAGQEVAGNEIGEVYLGGPGVARGYVGQPGRTAAAFVPDPRAGRPGARLYRTGDLARRDANGVLHFHGRRDTQVKLRGFRIELAEIEATLRGHDAVADAAVLLDDRAAAGPRLVAYVVSATDGLPDLRGYLTERLPPAMVPAAYVLLTALPTNHHGKVDRQALSRLPVTEHTASDYEPPATEVELRLAPLWQDLLGLPAVGRADNFFDLGGHSLLATRLVARIRQRFEVEIQVRDVYDAPTLWGLGDTIARLRNAGRSAPAIRRVARARQPPAPTARPSIG